MARQDRGEIVVPQTVGDVYRALTDPNSLVTWLPPSGMSGRFEHIDLRPGGSYRMVLTYEDAAGAAGKSGPGSDVVDVRFVEIVPNERIVQAVEFDSVDPAFAGTMTLTWRVDEVEVGTRVEIVADNVPVGISAEDHAAGLESSLANLAEWLQRAE